MTKVIRGRVLLQMRGPSPPFSLFFLGRGSEPVIKSWSWRPSASDNLSARWQLLHSEP